MSYPSGWAKFISLRACLALGKYAVTLSLGTLLLGGPAELSVTGSELLASATWAGLLSGDATALVVIALIGVVLVSRRHLPH